MFNSKKATSQFILCTFASCLYTHLTVNARHTAAITNAKSIKVKLTMTRNAIICGTSTHNQDDV